MRNVWVSGLALVLLATGAFANDSELREEIQDLRCVVAAMESAEMAPSAGGDVATLTSMKKKGQIQIGGRVDMDVYSIHRDDRTSGGDNVDSTQFRTTTAALMFRVAASKDSFLHIKLDLDDFWNAGTVNQDDLLEECYFMWKNVRRSNWSLRFGKGETPYGLDKDPAITKSYHHNSSLSLASYLSFAHEQAGTTGSANPRTRVGNWYHPGEHDNVFLVQANYVWKDLAKLEMAVFQNDVARGMHEDRSDDHLGFQSFSARLSYMPMENLTLMASVINEHNDSRGDGEARTAMAATSTFALPAGAEEDATSNQTAIDIAFDWKLKCMPLQIWGEYQHGFNWRYDRDYEVDILSLGAIYGVTEKVDVIVIGEWMGFEAENNTALYGWDEDENLYKGQLAGRYTFNSGMKMILEYTHEWHENDRDDDEDHREADTIAFRTMWAF